MDLVTIYNEKDMQIQIEKNFLQLLKEVRQFCVLEKAEQNYLFTKTLEKLSYFTDIEEKKIITCEKIPILKRQSCIFLASTFEILQEPLLSLQEEYDYSDSEEIYAAKWQKKIVSKINDNTKEIRLFFFDELIEEVSGVLTGISDKHIYVIPVIFEENVL